MRSPNEQRTDGWGHNNWRAGFYFKRAETRDHDRRVHGVNAPAACSGDCLLVVTDELHPALLICSGDYRGCETIPLQRDGNTEVEIVILNDLIVFQNQPAKRRGFFHLPPHRPRHHNRRGGGVLGGGCFSIARTTAHAIMTEGEGGCSAAVFFNACRAS